MLYLMLTFIGGSITYMWLWAAIAFAVIEAITVGIVSIWFTFGALAAMLSTLVTDNIFIQFLVFFSVSGFLLVKTRKIAVEKLKIGQQKTNIDELIGEECLVVTPIEAHGVGEVKLNGKIWRACSESKQSYETGELASVLRIEGVTIILK